MSIRFYCRVRGPLQQELHTSKSRSSIKNNKSRSSSLKRKSSSLSKDYSYCFFSSNDQKPKLLVSVENPIKAKLIDSYFKRDSDVLNCKDSVLDRAEVFEFDHVFANLPRSANVYQDVLKSRVNSFLKNESTTFVVFGPKKSDKYGLLMGSPGDREKGLVQSFVEDSLNLIEINSMNTNNSMIKRSSHSAKKNSLTKKKPNRNFKLFVSVWAENNGELIDLLSTKTNKVFVEENMEVSGLTQYEIKFASEFSNITRMAMNALRNLKKDLDFVITLKKERTSESSEFKKFTRVNFVRLCDRKGRKDEIINYLGAFTYECQDNSFLIPQIIKSSGIDYFEFLLTISCAEQSYKISLAYLKRAQDVFDFINEKEDRRPMAIDDGSDNEIEEYIDKHDERRKSSKKKIRTNSSDSDEVKRKKSSKRSDEIVKDIRMIKTQKNSTFIDSPTLNKSKTSKDQYKKRSLTRNEDFRNFEYAEEALQKKKIKIADLKSRVKDLKRDLANSKDENSRLQNENQRYQLEVETLRDKGAQSDLTNKVIAYQKEICSIRQKYEEELAIRERYEQKLDEAEENRKLMEEKIYRMKQKYDEEASNLYEKLSKRKEKIEALSAMIEERDQKILEGMKYNKSEYRDKEMYEKESTRLGGELSRLLNSNTTLKQEVEKEKNERMEIQRKLENTQEEKRENEKEIERLTKQLKISSEDKRAIADLLEAEKEECEELTKTISQLKDDSKNLKSINDSLNHKLKIIEREQNKELDQLEGKLDEVIKELNNAKGKNRILEASIEAIEGEKKEAHDLLARITEEKDSLKIQLDDVENRMREIISEKTVGLKTYPSKENIDTSQRNLVEKLKVLDEIHSAIKAQKKSGSKYSMDYEF